MLKPKLTRLVQYVLLDGPKQTGSYDPEEIMPRYEERLTGYEDEIVRTFLAWVNEDEDARHYGHGNLESRFKEWEASLK